MRRDRSGMLAYIADDGHQFNSVDCYLEYYLYIIGVGYMYYRGEQYALYSDAVDRCIRDGTEYHSGRVRLNPDANYEM